MKLRIGWKILLLLLLGILVGLAIYIIRYTLFQWQGLAMILELGLVILIWHKYPAVRKLIGEDKPMKRTGLARAVDAAASIIWPLLFASFSLYFMVGDLYKSGPGIAQFSPVVIAPILGGLLLTAASNFRKGEKRSRLMHVAQKFILATVMSIIFVPSLFMSGLIDSINIKSITFSSLGFSSVCLVLGRAIYFWLLAVPSFYLGVVLLLWGLRDLVSTLIDIDDETSV